MLRQTVGVVGARGSVVENERQAHDNGLADQRNMEDERLLVVIG
jgi:hypothetical protein